MSDRFTRAELDFIRDRVLAEVRANPCVDPLPEPSTAICGRGHEYTRPGRCMECERLRKQRRRAEGVTW